MKKASLLLPLIALLIIAPFAYNYIQKMDKSSMELDTDNDGLNDYEERFTYKTAIDNYDTDRDGLLDFEEINGCLGVQGADQQLVCGTSTFGATDPNKVDSDEDGIWDFGEIFGCSVTVDNAGTVSCREDTETFVATNPTLNDTDGDMLLDGEEVTGCLGTWDKNKQTIICSEVRFSQTNPHTTDSDLDEKSDAAEVLGCETFERKRGVLTCTSEKTQRSNPNQA